MDQKLGNVLGLQNVKKIMIDILNLILKINVNLIQINDNGIKRYQNLEDQKNDYKY